MNITLLTKWVCKLSQNEQGLWADLIRAKHLTNQHLSIVIRAKHLTNQHFSIVIRAKYLTNQDLFLSQQVKRPGTSKVPTKYLKF
jgi:hypothetical protein